MGPRRLTAWLGAWLGVSCVVGLTACASLGGDNGVSARPTVPAQAPHLPAAPTASDLQRRGEFDKALDSWHGAPVAELLRKLGKPDAIAQRADGSLEYQYSRSTRAGADKRPAFSCTVWYAVDAVARRVTGHAIEGC
jgi:hypothetical protein